MSWDRFYLATRYCISSVAMPQMLTSFRTGPCNAPVCKTPTEKGYCCSKCPRGSFHLKCFVDVPPHLADYSVAQQLCIPCGAARFREEALAVEARRQTVAQRRPQGRGGIHVKHVPPLSTRIVSAGAQSRSTIFPTALSGTYSFLASEIGEADLHLPTTTRSAADSNTIPSEFRPCLPYLLPLTPFRCSLSICAVASALTATSLTCRLTE